MPLPVSRGVHVAPTNGATPTISGTGMGGFPGCTGVATPSLGAVTRVTFGVGTTRFGFFPERRADRFARRGR